MSAERSPILVVGAGPTGLALAAQLRWLGANVRIVDRSLDRARESRALGVQARTLEVLDALGLGALSCPAGGPSAALRARSGC